MGKWAFPVCSVAVHPGPYSFAVERILRRFSNEMRVGAQFAVRCNVRDLRCSSFRWAIEWAREPKCFVFLLCHCFCGSCTTAVGERGGGAGGGRIGPALSLILFFFLCPFHAIFNFNFISAHLILYLLTPHLSMYLVQEFSHWFNTHITCIIPFFFSSHRIVFTLFLTITRWPALAYIRNNFFIGFGVYTYNRHSIIYFTFFIIWN